MEKASKAARTTNPKARSTFHPKLKRNAGAGLFIGESITDAEYRLNEAGMARIGLDLRPKVLDVGVDRSLVTAVGASLGCFQELKARERPPWLADERR
jgi:hypothetical protein